MTVLLAPVSTSTSTTTGRTSGGSAAPAATVPAGAHRARTARAAAARTPAAHRSRAARASVPAQAKRPACEARSGQGAIRGQEERREQAIYPTFSSYVRARGPVLLRTARSLTSNASDAEDLLQTALTKTYVAWDRIEDHRALDGYVRRALLNTRTSQWRKRKVDEFACDDLPEPSAVSAQDPAEGQALRDAMWRAIVKLPARQRAMVVLRYYEDLSEAQTAEVLGVSVGTVKSAVSRALGKLRDDPELNHDAA